MSPIRGLIVIFYLLAPLSMLASSNKTVEETTEEVRSTFDDIYYSFDKDSAFIASLFTVTVAQERITEELFAYVSSADPNESTELTEHMHVNDMLYDMDETEHNDLDQ